RQIKTESESALKNLSGTKLVHIDVQHKGAPQAGSPQSPWAQHNRLPGLRHVIAVASGKGGVGKSTLSVNLACALHHLGASVGLLVEDDQPVIWRGPMIMKTIQQFFSSVEWGELDFLLVDLPPGTGDAQLSLCQTVPLDGGVIVTTPQEASVGVVRKGIAMFEKVNVPILGIIENMSYFTAPGGERVEIFGHGGGQAEAERQKIPFLGEIPIYVDIRIGGDQGVPVTVSSPKGPS